MLAVAYLRMIVTACRYNTVNADSANSYTRARPTGCYSNSTLQ